MLNDVIFATSGIVYFLPSPPHNGPRSEDGIYLLVSRLVVFED